LDIKQSVDGKNGNHANTAEHFPSYASQKTIEVRHLVFAGLYGKLYFFHNDKIQVCLNLQVKKE
jgi:hypothetical protein